jgi:hypothetical protein
MNFLYIGPGLSIFAGVLALIVLLVFCISLVVFFRLKFKAWKGR